MKFLELCKVHWKQILGYSVLLHLLVHELPLLIIILWSMF